MSKDDVIEAEGKVLEALLDGVIREEYPNERQALLAAVQQFAAS